MTSAFRLKFSVMLPFLLGTRCDWYCQKSCYQSSAKNAADICQILFLQNLEVVLFDKYFQQDLVIFQMKRFENLTLPFFCNPQLSDYEALLESGFSWILLKKTLAHRSTKRCHWFLQPYTLALIDKSVFDSLLTFFMIDWIFVWKKEQYLEWFSLASAEILKVVSQLEKTWNIFTPSFHQYETQRFGNWITKLFSVAFTNGLESFTPL